MPTTEIEVSPYCFIEIDDKYKTIHVGSDNRMNGMNFYAQIRTPAELDKLIKALESLRGRWS